MDNQQIFDIVYKHLLKQNARSVDGIDSDNPFNKCLYRSKHGLKCAIGALIPDHLYKPEFEKEGYVIRLLEKYPNALGFPVKDEGFLNALQKIHDGWEPHEWKDKLQETAGMWGLTIPSV